MEKEAELIGLLRENGLKIATAESLTGGLVSATLVGIPGASNAFLEGFVTYDTAAKERTLKIDKAVLQKEGAISPVTASLMALGAASNSMADIALATTGNAGPDPSEGKPVGLVYTAVAYDGNVSVFEHHFTGSRYEIRKLTTDAVIEEALDILKKRLEKNLI